MSDEKTKEQKLKSGPSKALNKTKGSIGSATGLLNDWAKQLSEILSGFLGKVFSQVNTQLEKALFNKPPIVNDQFKYKGFGLFSLTGMKTKFLRPGKPEQITDQPWQGQIEITSDVCAFSTMASLLDNFGLPGLKQEGSQGAIKINKEHIENVFVQSISEEFEEKGLKGVVVEFASHDDFDDLSKHNKYIGVFVVNQENVETLFEAIQSH